MITEKPGMKLLKINITDETSPIVEIFELVETVD